MQLKWKRLLTATLAATSLICFGGGVNIIHAEDVKPDSASNNDIEVRENSYTINGTQKTVSDSYGFVYGGGGETNSAASYNNKIKIHGGNFGGIFGGIAASGKVFDNCIVVYNGTITGIAGGVAIWHGTWDTSGVEVSGNKVEIYGGNIGNVSGGEIAYSYLTSGSKPSDFSSVSGNVHGNTVEIYGGTVKNVIGGAALGGNAYGNTIVISGGTITGEVIGGKSEKGSAYNNTITIEGSPNLTAATLWGGKIGSDTSYTGNTLNVNTCGVTVKNINGFSVINFNLPNQVNGTVLTLTSGTTYLGGGLEMINVTARGDSNIGTGSTLNILYNNNGINLGGKTLLGQSNDEGTITYNSNLNRGGVFDYDIALSLSEDGKSLTGTVGRNKGVREETRTSTKAQLANVVTINNGTDNLVDNFNDSFGFDLDDDTIQKFTDEDNDTATIQKLNDKDDDSNGGQSDQAQKVYDVTEQHGFEIFASGNFGHLRTKTGDGGRVTTDTHNFDLGLARTYDSPAGRWIVAPVIEHGTGNYDAFLSTGIKGYGNTKYTAGGLIARRINKTGYYFETSFRFGRAKNDFATDEFNNGKGNLIRATYHTSAPVFAGHFRIGHAKRLNKNNLLDIYGIYAYTRQGGIDTKLSTGTPYRFSSITSSRFRLGYRLTTRTSKISRIYTGLAWQYENTSDAVTRAMDAENSWWSLPTAGSKGSSGMLEIGWMIKPNRNNPWLVDVNATGWLGHQRGATAMAKIKKSF